jgi:hypothetical protein
MADIDMKSFIMGQIEEGDFVLSDMEERIKTMYITGDISADDMGDLLKYAAEHAVEESQVDLYSVVMDLKARLDRLEGLGATLWTSEDKITNRGQVRLYDIDKDGVLDLVRYDGGRASTSLSPGKIEGWVKVDGSGNVTHTITRNEAGDIVLVPYVSGSEEGGEA